MMLGKPEVLRSAEHVRISPGQARSIWENVPLGRRGGGENVLEAVLPQGTCNSQGEGKKGQSNTSIYTELFFKLFK